MGKESFSTVNPGNGAGRAREKHWSYPDCGRGSLGRLIFEDVHMVLLLLGTWFKKHRKEFSESCHPHCEGRAITFTISGLGKVHFI